MLNSFYQTAEIRWFWPGTEQWPAWIDWFTLNGQLSLIAETEVPKTRLWIRQERPRTDDYLLLPNCETAGVKQREGRLEVKALLAGPHPFTQGDIAGRMDQWVKWSLLPSAHVALPLAADLQQSGPWGSVAKQRYTQQMAQVVGELTAVAPDTFPDAGCHVELTQLQVTAEPTHWLTLGFEAFGQTDRPALLDKAIAYFFAAYGPPPFRLSQPNSFSYPAWLVNCAGGSCPGWPTMQTGLTMSRLF